jgi:hypothetical protein
MTWPRYMALSVFHHFLNSRILVCYIWVGAFKRALLNECTRHSYTTCQLGSVKPNLPNALRLFNCYLIFKDESTMCKPLPPCQFPLLCMEKFHIYWKFIWIWKFCNFYLNIWLEFLIILGCPSSCSSN